MAQSNEKGVRARSISAPPEGYCDAVLIGYAAVMIDQCLDVIQDMDGRHQPDVYNRLYANLESAWTYLREARAEKGATA